MKLIKITTDNEISVHEFPEGNYSEQNEALADLIGPKCRLCEHVMPNRLYKELLEGKYLPYKQMFCESDNYTIVGKSDLVGAMTRAKMCTDEKSPAVFDISENEITVSIRDNIANYQEKVALQEKIKDPIKIGFDSRLVLETIKAFTCDNITLNLTRPVNPMVVEAEDSDMKALVLPVRLKE